LTYETDHHDEHPWVYPHSTEPEGDDPTALGGPQRSPIRTLSEALVARIAAGEIVERPASVVKELVENSLDAGSRTIRVDVRGGGLTMIRVGDDGAGVPAEELHLACMRHSTSKLGSGGLEDVVTLGFRGEALPSIAAVAELSLTSATEHDGSGVGRRIVLRDGQVIADEPAPRPRGTTATARFLFQNVPARLAASRNDRAETAQIAQTVRRLAVAAPHVRLTLAVEDRILLETTGSGDLATTLLEVYGHAIAESLSPLGPIEIEGSTAWGVVSGPEVTRPGRGCVHVVVNGRWVQPRGLLARIETEYRPVLPRGRHPVLALVVRTPPDRVDVNIHPSKLEVRLMAEREIGAALGRLVRSELGRRPVSLRQPFEVGLDVLRPAPELAEESPAWGEDDLITTPNLPPLSLVGQVQNRLILLEGAGGLYLVDQHRAHERVIYGALAAAHAGDVREPTALPEPLLIELSPAQAARLSARLATLVELGFEIEHFGGRTFLLRAAPSSPLGPVGAWSDDPAATVLALADDGEYAGEGEAWRERLLERLACRSAIRRGRPLGRAEMRSLVEALGRSSAPAVCPHGSPLLLNVSESLLEREFRW